MIEGKYEGILKGNTCTLRWDNTYSIVRGKELVFRAVIVSKEVKLKAEEEVEALEELVIVEEEQVEEKEEQQQYLFQDPLVLNPTTCTHSQLLLDLERSITDLISNFMSFPDISIHEGHARSFILSIEAILKDGIKSFDYYSFLNHLTSVLRDDQGVTNAIEGQFKNEEEQSTSVVFKRFLGWNKGRAMLFMLLNKNLFGKALDNLIKRQSILQECYQNSAFLRDYDIAKRCVDLISALHGILFKLEFFYTTTIEEEEEATTVEMNVPESLLSAIMVNCTVQEKEVRNPLSCYHWVGSCHHTPNDIKSFTDCSPVRVLLHSQPLVQKFIG